VRVKYEKDGFQILSPFPSLPLRAETHLDPLHISESFADIRIDVVLRERNGAEALTARSWEEGDAEDFFTVFGVDSARRDEGKASVRGFENECVG